MRVNCVTASEYMDKLPPSYDSPHVIIGDDGNEYVVKFPSNNDGRTNYNEYFGASLASHFGLPVLDIIIMKLTKEFIKLTQKDFDCVIEPGNYFATLKQKIMEFDLKMIQRFGADELSNQNDVSKIIVFDIFISNCDRHIKNLLIIKDVDAHKNKYVLIDHGNAFGGPDWNYRANNTFSYAITRIPWKLDGVSISQCKKAATEMCALTAAEIDVLLEELPENWNPNDYNIAVRRALLNRDKSEILNAINDNQTMRNALQLSEEQA